MAIKSKERGGGFRGIERTQKYRNYKVGNYERFKVST